MYLQKKKNILNTTRFNFLPNYLTLLNKNFNFYFFKKNKYNKNGINISGQLVMYSKKKKIYNYFSHNSFISWNKQSSLIINFKQIFLKTLFFLLKYTNGSYTLQKSIFGLFIGDYLNFFFFFFNQYKYKFLGWQTLLIFIPKYIFLSNLKTYYFKISKYSSADGNYIQIIEKFKDLNLLKIRLPSGKKKIFYNNTIGTLGRNNNIFKKYSCLGSYKLNWYLGKRFIVRGVAMNPVDHPHGGRTKTNKPEVSPWNWVTKFSH